MSTYDTSAGWSNGLMRGLGVGFGRGAGNDVAEKTKRKHRALCDGAYCEWAWCEKGKAWRKTQTGEKWKKIDEPTEETGETA